MATLKKGSKGDEVRKFQNYLIALGYTCGSAGADGSFGSSTESAVKKYQQSHNDTNGNPLSVDGKLGPKTQAALTRDYKALKESYSDGKKFSINLKKGMKGRADIKYMQELLTNIGYNPNGIDGSFGSGMESAVKKFQRDYGLTADGIIGKTTWNKIIEVANGGAKPTPTPAPTSLDAYTWISASKRAAIAADLANVNDMRKAIVMEILNYACDADQKKEMRAIYMFGANLYNTDLTLNYADIAELNQLKKAHPEYFDGGRYEMMVQMIKANPRIPVSDCSGMEVGYLREHRLVSNTFDATANGLASNSYSAKISKNDLVPGDWVQRTGHIGTYVGGGYVVEFYGGAFGCQLTKLNDRRGWDFIANKTKSGSAWTNYRRPKYY